MKKVLQESITVMYYDVRKYPARNQSHCEYQQKVFNFVIIQTDFCVRCPSETPKKFSKRLPMRTPRAPTWIRMSILNEGGSTLCDKIDRRLSVSCGDERLRKINVVQWRLRYVRIVMLTKTDASTTRTPFAPFRRRLGSTTAISSSNVPIFAVQEWCPDVTAPLRTHAASSSSLVAVASAPKGLSTKPFHGGVASNALEVRTACTMIATSRGCVINAGSMIGKAKGSFDARVTFPP